jgi:hypothetical protein
MLAGAFAPVRVTDSIETKLLGPDEVQFRVLPFGFWILRLTQPRKILSVYQTVDKAKIHTDV